MTNFSISTCFLLFSVVFGTVWCDPRISRIYRRERSLAGSRSQSHYHVLVKEQGSHFTEEVKFDMNKGSIVYNVPAHRNIDQAEVLTDYVSNLTVTRLPARNVCYIRPHDADEPSLKKIKESMELVSRKKVMVKKGVEVLSSEWTVKGPANISKLRPNVVEFCGGLPIYELELLEQDGIMVQKAGNDRQKRAQLRIKLCKPFLCYDLSRCPDEKDWNYVCTFPSHNCVYRVTCNGLVTARDTGKCTDRHILVNVLCCDLSCK